MTSYRSNVFPKTPSSNTISLGPKASTYEFVGGHNSVHRVLKKMRRLDKVLPVTGMYILSMSGNLNKIVIHAVN